MRRPWLSVILPTYNGEKHLASCLDSVADQGKLDDVECLAVDDGSTDGTADILKAYARRLPLKVLPLARTGNWTANTNKALVAASGAFACFLHQDDIWLNGRLDSLRFACTRFPEVDFFVSSARFIDREGKYRGLWRCPLPDGPEPISPALFLERLIVQNFIAIPAPIFSRRRALELGGLDEDLGYTADWDFWMKLAGAVPAKYIAGPLVGFRIHTASQTLKFGSDRELFRQQLATVLHRHLPKVETLIPGTKVGAVARLSVLANETLAALACGRRAGLGRLIWAFLALGPAGQLCYVRYSRIFERTLARLGAGLARRK